MPLADKDASIGKPYLAVSSQSSWQEKGGLVPSLRITRNLRVPGTGKATAFPLPCQLRNNCPRNSQPWQDGIKSHLSS